MAFFDEQFGGEQVFQIDEQSQSLSQMLGDTSMTLFQQSNELTLPIVPYYQNKNQQFDQNLNFITKNEDDRFINDNGSSDSTNRTNLYTQQKQKFQPFITNTKFKEQIKKTRLRDIQHQQENSSQCNHHIGRPLSESQAIFHTIEGKLFMSVDYILDHPQNAVQMAEQQKKRLVTRQQNSKHKVEHGHEFHWSKEYCTMFALACMAIGIQNVTPKQLQGVLPFEISRESVGSHLQKYRLKLQKQYHLTATGEIRNYHYPKDIDDERLLQFKEMWEQGFTGFSLDEVKQLLLQND